jgi:hypothetical protein
VREYKARTPPTHHCGHLVPAFGHEFAPIYGINSDLQILNQRDLRKQINLKFEHHDCFCLSDPDLGLPRLDNLVSAFFPGTW